MAEIDGTCAERFEAVRGALARNLDSGAELGASLVVDIDGDIAVDMWGGFCDLDRTVPWTEHTITNVWSSTKTVTRLAAQAPWWPPGTASGYHALNYGHLVGEVVRRISGKTLKQFVAEEIAGPLGADFQIGAAESDWGRIADVVPPPPLPFDFAALDPASPAVRTLTGPLVPAEVANTPGWRRADIGAANGHGNARSVARIMSVLARGGEVDGVRLLGQDTIETIFKEQTNGIDLVLGVPLRFGIGYGLPQRDSMSWIPEERICFWGGWGGSLIAMDLGRRMTISYMMNKMGAGILGSDRSTEYGRAIYAAVAG